jgi:hypothetical protein
VYVQRHVVAASPALDREVDRCRSAFDALLEIVQDARRPSPDAVDALVRRIDGGEFGSLAKALVPPVARLSTQAGRTLDRADPVLSRLGP